jgi:hypothetical protein
MGQAKQRGNFEQRRELAIARKTSQPVSNSVTPSTPYRPTNPRMHNAMVTTALCAGIMANGLAGKK